jgi:hypothetical protein
MKIKNKIFTLLGVFTLVGLTHSLTLKELNASLTAPASYDYGYVWSGSVQQYTSSNGTSPTSIALFTRTTDGAYYNYSHTFSNSGSHSNTANYDLPDGLDITMTFNRSNTSWTDASPSYTGYYPTENKIGSSNAVGTISNKTYVKFDNQTNKDYYLYFDISSNAQFGNYQVVYNTQYLVNNSTDLFYTGTTNSTFLQFLIPSYYSFEIYRLATTASTYLDSWYLKDLGVSDSYDAGYDAGLDDGYVQGQDDADLLVTGFQAMVGILVNFVLMIVNLEVFGVSILSVFSILALFVGVIWILKIIRG